MSSTKLPFFTLIVFVFNLFELIGFWATTADLHLLGHGYVVGSLNLKQEKILILNLNPVQSPSTLLPAPRAAWCPPWPPPCWNSGSRWANPWASPRSTTPSSSWSTSASWWPFFTLSGAEGGAAGRWPERTNQGEKYFIESRRFVSFESPRDWSKIRRSPNLWLVICEA